MVTRTELGLAAACAAWAAVFLAGEGAALAFAPLLGLVVLPHRRHPIGAALAVSVVVAAVAASGVSEENPATLAAGLTVTYALGRHAPGPLGYAPVLALAFALTAVGGPAWVDVVFVVFVLTGTWACGRVVRRRSERSRMAAAAAEELAERDTDALAAQVVAEERARLAGEALAVIRRSVEAMRSEAVAAERELDPRPLQAIQERGRAAVAELRRLLGLLRSDPEPPSPQGRPGHGGDSGTGRPGRTDVLIAAGLAGLCLVDVAAWRSGAAPGAIALTLAFAAAAALARYDAVAGCLLAAVPWLLAAALDATPVYGFSTAVACAVLAWSAGADGRPRGVLALAAPVAATLAVTAVQSPGNEGILLAAFALSGLAGRAWGQRDREGAAAAAAAARLRAEHEAVVEHAVRAERLRLARELHDVVSHAVGVMVIQAAAALALREREPGAARSAVREVQAAGSEATGELAVLFGLLDAGAIGSAGLAAPQAERDVVRALSALADRMRGGGLHVAVTVAEPLPDDPTLVATAYRIVQEALTNAARHSPGSRVDVVLAIEDRCLEVTVRDDGAGTRPEIAAPNGGGFGLVGVAERVRALGGELAAGPAPGGGFVLTARLPTRERDKASA
jgi:signal transduction histidine kinase